MKVVLTLVVNKTNKNKIHIKETMQNHSTNNPKQIMWNNMAERDRPQMST